MEDLDYQTSAKGMFSKQMLDAAFGQFRSIVKYVCWKRGKFFCEVDARGTSQQCPECGGEVKKVRKITSGFDEATPLIRLNYGHRVKNIDIPRTAKCYG